MLRRRNLYHGSERRGIGVFRAHRLALMAVAAGAIAAGVLATHVREAPQMHSAPPARKAFPDVTSSLRKGEPQLSRRLTAPRAPRTAAVGFVRDFVAWEAGKLATLPSRDAVERVIELLERAGRHALSGAGHLMGSVRMAVAGARRYVVTSAVGNFLLGQRGSRWLVVSVPGD